MLSACETGLGDVTGEGVFGLQRGFKKAGAKTLIMSLWKVNDASTEIMMTKFYSNLADGQTKYQAFINAQRFLREYTSEKHGTDGSIEILRFSDPRYWAAFIMLDGK